MNFDQAWASNFLTPNNYKGLVADRYETALVCNNNTTNMPVLLPAYRNAVLLSTCNERLSEIVPSTRMQQNVVNVNQDNMCCSALKTSIRNDHCISSCALSSYDPERSDQYTKHSQEKESNGNVGTLELITFHRLSGKTRKLNIDWCTDANFSDYRFVIEGTDPLDSRREPASISSACKDIDVCFDDDNQRILIDFKYLDGHITQERTFNVPYMRATRAFEDHEHINQKRAVEQFLKSFAVNTGEDKQVINGKEFLYKNYIARPARHTPVHELSSDPVQISQDILLLQEKCKKIQAQMQKILTDHADMNCLIESILSSHSKMD